MVKVTITQTNGMTEEKAFDDVFMGWRWALLKIQSDVVRSVEVEKVLKNDE